MQYNTLYTVLYTCEQVIFGTGLFSEETRKPASSASHLGGWVEFSVKYGIK